MQASPFGDPPRLMAPTALVDLWDTAAQQAHRDTRHWWEPRAGADVSQLEGACGARQWGRRHQATR